MHCTSFCLVFQGNRCQNKNFDNQNTEESRNSQVFEKDATITLQQDLSDSEDEMSLNGAEPIF